MQEERKLVSTRVPLSVAAEIDRIAEKRKMSLSEVMRMLLEVGVECHKDMERIGLIGVVDLVYFIKESIKEKSKGKQLKLI